MDQEKIEELVNMGFNRTDVVGALKKSNGDTNLAATYLMDGYTVSYDHQSADSQVTLPPAYDESVVIPGMDEEITDKISDNLITPNEPFKEYNPIANKYSIYDDIPRTKRGEDGSAVVLPSSTGLYDSYLAPLVVILNNIPILRNLLLKHQYFSYGFKPNWWNKEKMFDSNQFPMELQRLLIMLSDESQRAFSSTYNLSMATNKLASEDIESGPDYMNFIVNSIVKTFSKANTDLESGLKQLLEVTLSTTEGDEGQNMKYYVIPLQSGDLKSDLYEDISTVFWGSNLQNFNHFKLETLSDIITIPIDTEGQSIEHGFDLLDEFYPQVFSKEHSYIIGEKYDKVNQLATDYESNLQSIQDMRVFQGKKISSILSMAGDYLQTVGESLGTGDAGGFGEGDKASAAGQSIKAVNDHITKYREELQETNEGYTDRLRTLRELMANPAEIVREHVELEPWILTGVVLSPTDYYYKTTEDEWVRVQIDQETCKDYQVEKVDFQTLHHEVRGSTCIDFDSMLVLTYVKRSVWENNEIVKLSGTQQDFLTMDNSSLNEMVKVYEGQSVIPQLE